MRIKRGQKSEGGGGTQGASDRAEQEARRRVESETTGAEGKERSHGWRSERPEQRRGSGERPACRRGGTQDQASDPALQKRGRSRKPREANEAGGEVESGATRGEGRQRASRPTPPPSLEATSGGEAKAGRRRYAGTRLRTARTLPHPARLRKSKGGEGDENANTHKTGQAPTKPKLTWRGRGRSPGQRAVVASQ